jgi:hypothetical protein
MNLAPFVRTVVATLSLAAFAPAASVFKDGDPPAYSSRLDGPLQERMLDMTTDSFGNVYIVGSFNSDSMAVNVFRDDPLTTGVYALQTKVLRTAGADDIFVAKYNANGALLWVQSAGGTGSDYGTGVAVDGKGNVYITGSYSGTALIGGTTLDTSLRTADVGAGKVTPVNLTMSSDIFVAMLDSNGTFRWAKRLDSKLVNKPSNPTYREVIKINFGPESAKNEVFNGSPVFPSGYQNDYGYRQGFTSTNYGWTTFSDPNAPQNNSNSNNPDAFYDNFGTVTDITDRTEIFLRDRDEAWRLNIASGGHYRVTVRSGDLNGLSDSRYYYNLQLSTGEDGTPRSITNNPSPAGGIVQGSLEFDLVGPSYIWIKEGPSSKNDGLNSLKLEKLDDDPADLSVTGTWGLRTGDNTHVGKALAIDKDGNLYVKGRFLDTQTLAKSSSSNTAMNLNFVPALGDGFLIDNDTATLTGAKNSFVTRLKVGNETADRNDPASFTWDWLTPFGTGLTTDNTIIADLSTDPAGDVYVTGSWRGSLLGGGAATTTTAGTTNTEGFLLRLRRGDGQRNLLTTITTPTNSRIISPEAVEIDENGDAYVAGNFNMRLTNGVTNTTWTFQSAIGDSVVATPTTSVRDFFVAKCTNAGTWLWVTKPTGTGQRMVRSLALDPAGFILVTGAIDSGPVTFGMDTNTTKDFTPAVANSTEPFVGRLRQYPLQTPAKWENVVKAEMVTKAALTANQSRYHGVGIGLTPAGLAFWLVSSGRDSSLDRDLTGGGADGLTDIAGPTPTFSSFEYTFGTRTAPGTTNTTGTNGADNTALYGGLLLQLDLSLAASTANITGYYAGQEIPPPPGAALDSDGRPYQPEIVIDNDPQKDSSAFFYWDTVARKLFAVSPTGNAVVSWHVSDNSANTKRLNISVPTRWPTANDPAGALQVDVIGGGVSGSEPAVDLNYGEQRTHSFSRILFTNAQATEAGGKIQAPKEGYTTVLYVQGINPALGNQPALVQVVSHQRWQSVVGNNLDAVIGTEITSPLHEDSLSGFVVNAKARYDGDSVSPAYNRDTREGPIIPVNTDEAGDSDDMVVLWYQRSRTTGIYWPAFARRYDCKWPTNPEKIVITSSQGSDVAIPRATGGPIYPQEQLRPEKFQYPRIYHQPDKTKPGYNPNEEHALLEESQTREGASVYALRNDLNNLNPKVAGYKTSDPYVLLRYEDGENGGKPSIKVYKVDLTGTYTQGANSVTFDFTSYQGFAGNRVQAPFPLSVLGDRPETVGSGDPYWQDRTGAVWARSAGTMDVGYWYPKLADFWYDKDANGVDDPVVAIPWLEFTTSPPAPAINVTAKAGDPVNIRYTITWPANVPVLRVGDTLTKARDGLPDVRNWQSGEIIFDENDVNVKNVDPAKAKLGDPRNLSVRLFDAVSQLEVPFTARDAGGQLNNTPGKPLKIELGPAGKYRLSALPPHLKARVLFNPTGNNGAGGLSFEGVSPVDPTGESTPLINVMSPGERDELLRADDPDGGTTTNSAWDNAVRALYTLTRNPNKITISGGDGLYYGFGSVANGKPVLQSILGNAALTAGLGKGIGYVTLAENNDRSLEGNPVALHVIHVENPPYTGHIDVIQSDNVFDERVTLRHNADFGGDPSKLTFEWYYLADPGGPVPTALPPGAGWSLAASGLGLNSITVGGSGPRTLADGLYYVRYKGYAAGGTSVDTFTQYGGDRSGTDTRPIPMAVAGWIKRVTQGLNPFEQRVADFHTSATQTYVSMIQEAGTRYEGAVALNPAATNVNSLGLISLYETVLRRGLSLSINGTPADTTGVVNNSLLLAASRISDLYMLLGNEAFGDAQDPTIGFNIAQGPDFGTLSSGVFAFQNQLPSLIDEELGLLRGRDSSGAGVAAAPVYNHLFWNFTKGLEGEPAYVTNYNITDQNLDGFIDETDAATLYPQGHGDAWGHYLSATKVYYRLLRHPLFTWVPRSERVTVAGVGINVDYLDEVKFARAAAAKAKAGREIVDLTFRNNYVGDPRGQFQGYKDTDKNRAWGVDEWSRRAGQAAFFDWVTANAILPATSTKVGLEKIDRTTVTELADIATQFSSIEAVVEKVDRGLNPLGLTGDVIPFDIDPTFTFVGSTAAIGGVAVQGLSHFEQIYLRAQDTVKNALSVYDFANQATQRLRQIQLTANDFANQVRDEELDYKNRLIEIFGYPYEGDIGGGKTYPSGYDGPDLYKWMYVDVAEFSSDKLPQPSVNVSAYFSAMKFEASSDVLPSGTLGQITGHYFPDDVIPGTPLTGAGPSGTLKVDYPQIAVDQRSASGWAFASTPEMGTRRAPGTLQQGLAAIVNQEAAAFRAANAYNLYVARVQDTVDLLQARFGITGQKLMLLDNNANTQTTLNDKIAGFRAVAGFLSASGDYIYNIGDAAAESLPETVGLSNDTTAPIRGMFKFCGTLAKFGFDLAAAGLESNALFAEAEKDNLQLKTDLTIAKLDFTLEAQEKIKELEQLLREEVEYRAEIFEKQRELQSGIGQFRQTLADGQRLLQERIMHRQKVAGPVQTLRYQDLTFRNFRNDVLQKYRAAFDLAAQYVYLSARAYDYETCLLGTQGTSGQSFLASIVKQRSLGQFIDDRPINGVGGLSDPMARMVQNFTNLKGQLGFNTPQIETGRISMRKENFRIKKLELADGEEPDAAALEEERVSSEKWRQTLQGYRVADLWAVPEFRRYCRAFAPESAGAQPGLVIDFNTDITFGLNFFGRPLAGGDSSYDSSHFATKIREVGVWFENYNGKGLAETPRVYLVPVGMDIMRAPGGNSLETRQFQVVDQRLPLPLPIGDSDLSNPNWIPTNDSLSGDPIELRRFARFRAYHDGGGAGSDVANRLDSADLSTDTRLIGRSVWNTRWLLIIPGGTFLNNANEGLDTFINGAAVPGSTTRDGNGVKDIKLIFTTYAYPGL